MEWSSKNRRSTLDVLKDLMKNRFREDKPFKTSGDVFEQVSEMGLLDQEAFMALLLNNKHQILDMIQVSVGTINQSLVHSREVFAPAIVARATAIILQVIQILHLRIQR